MFWFNESYYNLSAKRSAILQGQTLFIIVKQKILFHFWASDRQTEETDRQKEGHTDRHNKHRQKIQKDRKEKADIKTDIQTK